MAKELGLFGLVCRQLRSSRGRTMADQAKAFDCSPSFISQIETGRRPVPEDYVRRLAEWLYLPESLEKQLEEVASESRRVIQIYPSDERRASLAVQFGKALNELPDEKLDLIRALIRAGHAKHTDDEIVSLANLLRGLFRTDDLLREVENLLTQVEPTAEIRVLPRGAKLGKTRSYSNTRRSEPRPHIAFAEDIYLAAADNRPDARKTLMEEVAHFLLHRGTKARDGGKHSTAHYAMEREADTFLIAFFLPKAQAVKFNSVAQASSLRRIPHFLVRDAMKRYGISAAA